MADGTLVDPDLLRDWPLPEPGADKEARGRLLVVAGSRDTPGAGLLAAEAAMRVGAGKVQLMTVRSCAPALAVAAPELMVTGVGEDQDGHLDPARSEQVRDCAAGSSAVLLGPGFMDPEVADALVGGVAPAVDGTLVLDALASAYVTGAPDRVARLGAAVVLTVNPTELAHCLECEDDEVEADLAGHAALLARRTDAVVVCGGPTKFVAHGDDLWRVEAGDAGLGTAGSGDVQAGIVTGLLGRGASATQAAVWGAYLHGAAGDALAERVGPVGFLARELPGQLPALLADLTA